MSDAPTGAGRALSLFSDPWAMPTPPADLMTFARAAYVLCCLSDPEGAARIAGGAGDQPVAFQDQARQAGLRHGDGEGFYAWAQASRLSAAAYDHICAQEGGDTPTPIDRYDG